MSRNVRSTSPLSFQSFYTYPALLPSVLSSFSSTQKNFKLNYRGICKRDVRRDKVPDVHAGIRVATCELITESVAWVRVCMVVAPASQGLCRLSGCLVN
jgi:hypothetical protein